MTTADTIHRSGVHDIPADRICLKHNIRTKLDLDPEFVASIEAQGVLQRTQVRPGPCEHDHPYVMVAGHRRATAQAKVRGPQALVPVEVIESDRELDLVSMLVENLQRKGLDPIDEARGYAELVQTGWSQADVARSVGKSTGHVSGRMALLQLHPDGLKLLQGGKINLEEAIALAKVDDDRVVKAVVKEQQSGTNAWRGMTGRIGHHQHKLKTQDGVAKKLKALKADGIAHGRTEPRDAVRVTLEGQAPSVWGTDIALDVGVRDFLKRPDAFVKVSAGNGVEVTYWTTDPARYEGDDQAEVRKPTRARWEVRREELVPVEEARREFVRAWWKGKATNADVMKLVLPLLKEKLSGRAHNAHLQELLGVDSQAAARAAIQGLNNAHLLKLYVAAEMTDDVVPSPHVDHAVPSGLLLAAGYERSTLEVTEQAAREDAQRVEWEELLKELDEDNGNEPWYATVREALLEVRDGGGDADWDYAYELVEANRPADEPAPAEDESAEEAVAS